MSFLNYVFGPKIYMEYKGLSEGQERKLYEPGNVEKFGEQVLSTLSVVWNISCYSSPLIVTFLYRRGYFVTDSLPIFAKLTTSIGLIVIISLLMRGFGRFQSRVYINMVEALEQSKADNELGDGKKELRRFDIEFESWPVDFDVNNVEGDLKKLAQPVSKRSNSFRLAKLPCDIAAYLAIHSFGLPLMYPGSIKILQKFMRPMLISGRAKLVEEDKGIRSKIKTIDSNEIDTLFIDNRGNNNHNGKTIVICSEGNAGFYEIGIMATPIALKYSVLGWNHPGFGSSTGKPYPDQDKNAINAVVQFAIHLGFAFEDIILYGWSIGGYSTLWAANCYPDVKGVILDATFDDVLHLAEPRMPASLSGIVKIAIRNYCNLNNNELIINYNGPILLIRRTEDEIIAEDNRIETNRGNFLALTLLKYRYPNIFRGAQLERIKKLISKPLEDSTLTAAEENLSMSRLVTYVSDQGKSFPMQIGDDYSDDVLNKMAVFLLHKHFRDYTSTHCTQLPGEYFNIPWDIPIEHGFVLT